jgi:hypothetical protein
MSFWDAHRLTIDTVNFRANNHYLGEQERYPYEQAAQLVKSFDRDWFSVLQEDGAFGSECHEIEASGYALTHQWRPLESMPRDLYMFERSVS